jgi:hypothetical protein
MEDLHMAHNIWVNGQGRFAAPDEEQFDYTAMGSTKIEVPDNIAYWRLTYDFENSALTVAHEGMSDADAEVAQQAAVDAINQAEAEAAAADLAARQAE